MTQDVGVAVTRITNFNPDKMIYVVASEQDRHFKILFAIVGHLLPEKSNICYHLSYGMVYLPTGKMKSREGTVIDADMLIEELQATALKMTRENWPHLSEEELTHRSLVIGLAALKFFFLSYTPDSPITYDKNKSLQGKEEEKEEEVKVVVTGEEENMTDDTKKKRKKKIAGFQGKTGPYLLYTYARTRSILRKANVDSKDIVYDPTVFSKLGTTEECSLLSEILWFECEIMRAATAYDTSKITDCLFIIAKAFSLFYKDKEKHAIIHCPDEELKKARLMLTYAVGCATKLGLSLLGIETLEEM